MAKPRVVLLHGVGLDHTMWQSVAALLQPEFEVIAPDLPGHGAQPPAPTGVRLADLAAGVAEHLKPGTHLVGFSLGAMVAQDLALHRPHLVATLTLVSPVCRRTEAEAAAVLARLAAAETDFAASAAASLQRWYAGTDTDPEAVRRTKATLLANDVASFLNCYRVFATADAELAPELSRISVPALAITGEQDPGSTPEMAHRLAQAMPDCRAVIVPDTWHMLPVQRPRELVTHLTSFIGEIVHV